jgi:hypothetical protein
MRRHTIRAFVLLNVAALIACRFASPAFAQTGNQPQTSSFDINLVLGTLNVETPDGNVIFTENDLAVSSALPGDLEAQIASDPTYGFPPYVTANLPKLIGPGETDFDFLNNTGLNEPSVLLTPFGAVDSGPGQFNVFNAAAAAFTFNGMTLPAQDFQAPQLVATDQFPLTGMSGGQQSKYDVLPSYWDQEVVAIVPFGTRIVPEASSLPLLAAGLVGIGLLAWSRRRKAVK